LNVYVEKKREGARWSFEKKEYEKGCVRKRGDPNSQQRKKK